MQEDNTESGGFFRQDQASDSSPDTGQPAKKATEPISWSASEFVVHQKDATWYLTFAAALAVIMGLIFITTKDLISVIAIGVVGILFGVIAGKKPRQLAYQVDDRGISIGEKFYPYGYFKSFSLGQEGVVGCINLLPLKRFVPEISIYFPPEEESAILDILSDNLPNEQRKEHSVDRISKHLRF